MWTLNLKIDLQLSHSLMTIESAVCRPLFGGQSDDHKTGLSALGCLGEFTKIVYIYIEYCVRKKLSDQKIQNPILEFDLYWL